MTPTHVFRNHAPRGYLGRPCIIVSRPPGGLGRPWRTGTETVTVEFEDGERLACIRSAVVTLDSRLGRQALRVARLSEGAPLTRAQLRTRRQREARGG